MIRDGPGDERAGTGSALEISLVQELLVRAQDRQPRNTKVGRETSGGRNPLARPQPPVEYGVSQPVVDLAEYRNPSVAVERKVQSRHTSPVKSGYADQARNGDGESTARPDIERVDATGGEFGRREHE